MASLRALLLFFMVLVAACTQAPAAPAPTLASLNATNPPAATATADTRITTQQAELASTLAAVQATQTALAAVPVAQPTDCGALAWWNFAGGSAIDAVATLSAAKAEVDSLAPNIALKGNNFIIANAYAQTLQSLTSDVAQRDYPLCIKAGRDALLGALGAYVGYASAWSLSLPVEGRSDPFYTPEELAEQLEQARALMQTAAAEIQRVTGADTSVLLDDGLDHP
jgi:hypothetical protein